MRVAITGAATGIGAQVAALIKASGADVTAFDITEPQSNINDWIETDLSDTASIRDAINKTSGAFDALINNAGLPPRDGLEEKILRVNYFGLKTFLNAMLDHLQPEASIVNTASRAGAMWRDNLAQVKALMALDEAELPNFIKAQNIDPTRAYNLSKEAVIVMTMSETENMIKRNLRMNSVSPAAVSTGILPDFAKAFGDKMTKNLALTGRPGTPEEIAKAIVFLASSDSQWIKGQDIVIDGGMSSVLATNMMQLRG